MKCKTSVNSPPTCSSTNCLYKCIRLVIALVISMFATLKFALAGPEHTLEKYGNFFNLYFQMSNDSYEDLNESTI